MRSTGRVDSNHREVVKALRDIGASVQSIADIGKGAPDLLCGLRNRNTILEVKNGKLPPSKRQLTPDEKVWHQKWRGQIAVVGSIEEALRVVLNPEHEYICAKCHLRQDPPRPEGADF